MSQIDAGKSRRALDGRTSPAMTAEKSVATPPICKETTIINCAFFFPPLAVAGLGGVLKRVSAEEVAPSLTLPRKRRGKIAVTSRKSMPLLSSEASTAPATGTWFGPEHCERLAVCLSTPLAPENGGYMSDPRHNDPRRNDVLRRLDLQGSGGAGMIWTWLAAIIAVIVVLGLVIGYSRTDQASLHSNPTATTGSAPSTLRLAPKPAPKSGDIPAPSPAAPGPARQTPDRDL
jgi:hypothetical protein